MKSATLAKDIVTLWQGRLRAVARRFDADQRGTALTEFVIVLPIFLLLFVGIYNLGMLQRRACEVPLRASQQVWTNALDVQKSSYKVKHKMPPLAAAAGVADIGLSTSPANWAAQWKKAGLGINGHHGESNNALTFVPNNVNPTHNKVSNYINEPFAADMVDDSVGKIFNPLPFPSGALMVFMPSYPFSFMGPRPAMATGINYGMVSGEYRDNFTMPAVGNFNMGTKYDVLVAPYARQGYEEFITVGFSRLAAEERDEFKEVLGIGCATASSRATHSSTTGWAILGLIGLILIRRRRRQGEPEPTAHS